jgi:TolB-like protein/Flp pilus assembly protein TadD
MMVRRSARALLLATLGVLASWRLAAAQCPDGTLPPCGRPAARVTAPAANSVAVLYFEGRAADTNAVALADGLSEEIINRLSGIERLTVRSRYLVRRYRDTALEDPAQVGRALNVAYLVSGSVRHVGGRLRVSAELVRAAGGAQVWGQQFDLSGDDVFAIQEEVARDVATGIVGRLLPSERQTLAARPTQSAAAYEAFLRGNFHLARRDSAGMRRAIDEFEAALRADPAYTDALARIALAYGIATANGVSVGFPRDTMVARAVRNATEAVDRAPRSSDAWVAMALARLAAQPGHPGLARDALERAVAFDATNAEAHHLLGFILEMTGQDSAGLDHDRRALAIEPARPVTLMHLAQEAIRRGRYAEGRRWTDSALVFSPDYWSARELLPLLMLAAGDTSSARAEVARWRDLPQLRRITAYAEQTLAPHGSDSASVRQWSAALRAALPAELPVSQGFGAALLAMLASRDAETVMAVFDAMKPRGAYLHYYMTFRAFDPIRDDPRFRRLFEETTP